MQYCQLMLNKFICRERWSRGFILPISTLIRATDQMKSFQKLLQRVQLKNPHHTTLKHTHTTYTIVETCTNGRKKNVDFVSL